MDFSALRKDRAPAGLSEKKRARGFVFFTNRESRKGLEPAGNPRASQRFPRRATERQAVTEGAAAPTPSGKADAYGHSRPRASQISAWASPQNAAAASRPATAETCKTIEKKCAGPTVPAPPHGNARRATPGAVECRQGRRNRPPACHRNHPPARRHSRRGASGQRIIERLAP
ncbi:MAG: hypothetical protein LBI02_07975 [Opitutaceae bacterium]|jgi:pyridoxamine 5'-phosphate oxidase|nr:hypothetical protein [Opitutaceae bacterium]